MERLDKIIGRETGYSRKDIKILVKNKRIKVNDAIVFKSDMKVSEDDIIMLDNNIIKTNKYVYLVLNKVDLLSKEELVKKLTEWQELYDLTKVHTVKFIKVKGHSDNEYNNRCDELARNAIKEL